MNKKLLTASFLVVSFISPIHAQAASFSEIYVFGDSLSDTGNVFKATGNTFPPPPYSSGRFSNGSIWVEYLAQKLDLPNNPDTNFAFGGATTGEENTLNTLLFPVVLPGLQGEIDLYKAASGQMADPEALYIIWAGANDYLPTESTFIPKTDPTIPVSNIATAVQDLIDIEAKNILVVNLPDLGELPLTRNTSLASGLNALSQAHNTLLSQTLDSLESSSGANISTLDVNSLFDKILSNPAKYNFTNVTEPCLDIEAQKNCSNLGKSDEYFFWDVRHPTTAGHQLIADLAADTVGAAGVPEPSFVPAVTLLGVWGAFEGIRRLQRQKSLR